ncbi:MAG: leucine-rich repeat domain-containing protein [Promethearchaeota archaeon]|nr:MAG: leucine-rich repeat domain-containing protein [Candidatus Lokiarchaeota archaeon]
MESLKELKSLYLDQNQISELVNIPKLSKLEYLECGMNEINKVRDIENFNNLKYLYLEDNKITDFSWIEKLSCLKVLDLSGNKISNVPKLHLQDLTHLESIDLYDNPISKVELAKLGGQIIRGKFVSFKR